MSIVGEYPPKHFTAANLAILEQLCRASAFIRDCDAAIAEYGLLIENKANPAVAMRTAAWAEVRACATKLRLSISSTMRAEKAAARPDPNAGLKKPWEE